MRRLGRDRNHPRLGGLDGNHPRLDGLDGNHPRLDRLNRDVYCLWLDRLYGRLDGLELGLRHRLSRCRHLGQSFARTLGGRRGRLCGRGDGLGLGGRSRYLAGDHVELGRGRRRRGGRQEDVALDRSIFLVVIARIGRSASQASDQGGNAGVLTRMGRQRKESMVNSDPTDGWHLLGSSIDAAPSA